MTPPKIRPLAICLFRRDDRILVFEGYDPTKRQTFYRPLGGGIEFGETGAEAVAREIREEIDAEIADVRFIRSLENIFTCDGRRGHEIVLLYEARFVDESLYGRERFAAVEDDGSAFQALWRRVDSFGLECPLYPDGLLDILKGSNATTGA